jgi:hypothetical protein
MNHQQAHTTQSFHPITGSPFSGITYLWPAADAARCRTGKMATRGRTFHFPLRRNCSRTPEIITVIIIHISKTKYGLATTGVYDKAREPNSLLQKKQAAVKGRNKHTNRDNKASGNKTSTNLPLPSTNGVVHERPHLAGRRTHFEAESL